MFSAAKFIVAGVVVALFGGFLLISMRFEQPAESVPAAATSGPGAFAPAGSLVEARWDPTATLLTDGRVLVVGGQGGDSAVAWVASVDVWDPVTESFSPTGSLIEARGAHTATLLSDGRVLVVGGSDNELGFTTGLASAEVWDPETGAFAPTGPLAESRGRHTATLLSDGRVLVVGGVWVDNEDHTVASAEVWDPVTESFSPAGSLAEARLNHTATLLSDGRVLVIGGQDRRLEFLASVEVWSP